MASTVKLGGRWVRPGGAGGSVIVDAFYTVIAATGCTDRAAHGDKKVMFEAGVEPRL